MSKVLIIAGIVFAILAIAFLAMPRQYELFSKLGTISDIQKNIEGLLSSNDEKAFLIITVTNTNQFVQFSAYDKIVQMDFPMIKDEQKDRRQKITEFCKSLGLELTVNIGTDGSEFLDYDLSGTPNEITSTIAQIISKVFNVSPTTELSFQTNGF